MKVDKSKWKKATLGEVCQIQMGQSPDSSTYNESGDGLPFYQGNADFGTIHPTPRVYCNAPKKIAGQGDILMSVRAPIGAVNVTDRLCAIGRGLSSITPKKELCLRGFIQYLIVSKNSELNKLGTGSVFKAINKANLHAFPISLPSLCEQKQIVAELDTIQGMIDGYKAQIADLDALAQSIFSTPSATPSLTPKDGSRVS